MRVRVDTTAYCGAKVGVAWCELIYEKEGVGSPYPFVVQLPCGGAGQFKRSEILGRQS